MKTLKWGEAAPWFTAEVANGSRYELSNMAGRFVVLVFLGDTGSENTKAFTTGLRQNFPTAHRGQVLIFGLTDNRQNLDDGSLQESFPGGRLFLDENNKIAKQYGVAVRPSDQGKTSNWFILDPNLRVWSSGDLADYDTFLSAVNALPSPLAHSGLTSEPWAPILSVPRILSTEECEQFIEYYRANTPRASGFMVTENGMTRERHNAGMKSRADVDIEAGELQNILRTAIKNRLAPEVKRSFQFDVTRIERYIVASYRAEENGRFLPHRDNTTAATAHRSFAVTINLNSEDYEGGELRFPEFGARTYSAPTGGAIVFSCSLLHEALPVTKGERFATLPFLYGEKGAKVRAKNKKYLAK